MNEKDIEAGLERSLRNQVKAPVLQKRFDAGVWARIDAEQARATAPAAPRKNWLFVLNGIGFGAAFLILVVFGGHWLMQTNVSLPELNVPASNDQVIQVALQATTVGCVLFGLMFTPLGRRLRQELV
jgi:hypothetical protein